MVSSRAGGSAAAYLVLAWLFIVLLPVQFFLAGIGAFGASDYLLHSYVGLIMHGISVLLILVALIGRLPARATWLGIVLFILISLQLAFVQLRLVSIPLAVEPQFVRDLMKTMARPFHDLLGGSVLWIASLHVLNALVIVGAAWATLRQARAQSAAGGATRTPAETGRAPVSPGA